MDSEAVERVAPRLSKLAAILATGGEYSISGLDCKDLANDLRALLSLAKPVGGEADALLEQFGRDNRLELTFYSPTYGDDDDQSQEWRVHRQSGSVNDREWTLLGAGETPLEAIRAALTAMNPEEIGDA